jgi:glyceraldehyde 3-phosphate dehydrogenase
LTRIFPHLALDLGGCGIRVPVPDGSLTDITCVVKKRVPADEINQAFKAASANFDLQVLEYSDEPLVSRDIVGSPFSCVFDSQLTSVIGRMVKVVGWYDNEIGYSHRLVDLAARLV